MGAPGTRRTTANPRSIVLANAPVMVQHSLADANSRASRAGARGRAEAGVLLSHAATQRVISVMWCGSNLPPPRARSADLTDAPYRPAGPTSWRDRAYWGVTTALGERGVGNRACSAHRKSLRSRVSKHCQGPFAKRALGANTGTRGPRSTALCGPEALGARRVVCGAAGSRLPPTREVAMSGRGRRRAPNPASAGQSDLGKFSSATVCVGVEARAFRAGSWLDSRRAHHHKLPVF